MGLVEECGKVLEELEKRGINYPDPLYTKMQTIKTTLDGWKSQMIFNSKEKGD